VPGKRGNRKLEIGYKPLVRNATNQELTLSPKKNDRSPNFLSRVLGLERHEIRLVHDKHGA
jgi:hypothetical protein